MLFLSLNKKLILYYTIIYNVNYKMLSDILDEAHKYTKHGKNSVINRIVRIDYKSHSERKIERRHCPCVILYYTLEDDRISNKTLFSTFNIPKLRYLFEELARIESYLIEDKYTGMCAALTDIGSVITWGVEKEDYSIGNKLRENVSKVVSSYGAFAALKNNGKVITWGMQKYGGNSSIVEKDLLSGVIDIVASIHAFSAIKENGQVISWGRLFNIHDGVGIYITEDKDVVKVEPMGFSFIATKKDGKKIKWGDTRFSEELQSGNMEVCELNSNNCFVILDKYGNKVLIHYYNSPIYFYGNAN